VGTLIWIVVCVVVALMSMKRPIVGIASTIVAYILMPYVAQTLITGDHGWHPASWLVLVWFMVTLLTRPQSIATEIGRRPLIYLIILVAVGGAFAVNALSGRSGGLSLMVDTMLTPVLFFIQLGIYFSANPKGPIAVRNVILTMAVVEVAISAAGWISGGPLFWVGQYSTKYWFAEFGSVRALGTMDDPLTLALFLSMCIPLIASVRKGMGQLALLVIFMSGIFLSQSRTALLLGSISIIYLLVRKGASLPIRLAIAVGSLIVVFAFFFGGLGNDVLTRLADDNGSSNARNYAWDYFGTIWHDYVFWGSGSGASYDVGSAGGLATSFESAILMYSIDFGIVIAVLYFGVLAVIALRGLGRAHLAGAGLAALVGVFTVQTFSSVGSPTAAGMLLWTFAALAAAKYVDSTEPPPGAELSAESASASSQESIIMSQTSLSRTVAPKRDGTGT
jgi:hypothetical protein